MNLEIFGNSVITWLFFVGTAAAMSVGILILKKILTNRLYRISENTSTTLDDFVVGILKSTKSLFIILLAIVIASFQLDLSQKVIRIGRGIFVLATMFQVAFWGHQVIHYFLSEFKRRRSIAGVDEATLSTTLPTIHFLLILALYSLLILLALDNLGFNVTAILAGLGVGGIAVALATQNILGDIFASLSIVFDKPFVIGDFIVVGDLKGTVERIGLKTTRIRSLSGEQLVFSNADLLASRIQNYKRMYERRVVVQVGVSYSTTKRQLERIPEMVKEILTSNSKVRFDRAHFKSFGESSLDFEIVYYVLDSDFNAHMDIQQQLHLELFERFHQEGISIPFPTRTLYMHQEQ